MPIKNEKGNILWSFFSVSKLLDIERKKKDDRKTKLIFIYDFFRPRRRKIFNPILA